MESYRLQDGAYLHVMINQGASAARTAGAHTKKGEKILEHAESG